MMDDIRNFDWSMVQAALNALLHDTEENEPNAKNMLEALDVVIAGLPENE